MNFQLAIAGQTQSNFYSTLWLRVILKSLFDYAQSVRAFSNATWNGLMANLGKCFVINKSVNVI